MSGWVNITLFVFVFFRYVCPLYNSWNMDDNNSGRISLDGSKRK